MFLAAIAVASISTPLHAQEAQAIVESSAKLYANAKSYSVQMESRTVQFLFEPSSLEETPHYEVLSTYYRRINFKMSRANNYYWLGLKSIYEKAPSASAIMTASEGPEVAQSESTSDFPAVGDLLFWAIARTDTGPVKKGEYQENKFKVTGISDESVTAMLRSKKGPRFNDNLMLRYYSLDASKPDEAPTFGLTELELIGRETSNGDTLWQISGTNRNGESVMLWINATTFFIERMLVQRADAGLTVEFGQNVGPRVCFVETRYKNQRMNVALSSNDFAVAAPVGMEKLKVEQMGFGSADTLANFSRVHVIKGHAMQPGAPAVPPPPPVAPVPDVSPALTSEQMDGIVSIEGDAASGIGFMVKIKGSDFVVTSLHMLGDNQKLSLKTLNGEELTMLGVFGASDRDIAIIRIPEVQGSLALAADLDTSVRIGDKVVLVSNQLAGGLATQTAGKIQGLEAVRIEVNADFVPGNSGSPLINQVSNAVLGVLTYTETRAIDREAPSMHDGKGAQAPRQFQKSWFGERLDNVPKWEAIDLSRWNDQHSRIAKFRETTEALQAISQVNLKIARQNPRFTTVIDNFETRIRALANDNSGAALAVKDFFRMILTTYDDEGMKDLMSGDYYGYYRTAREWNTSIPTQLEYRKTIIETLKNSEANPLPYLAQLRANSGDAPRIKTSSSPK